MDIEINFKKGAGKNADDKYKLKLKFEHKLKGLDIALNKIRLKLEGVKTNFENKTDDGAIKKINIRSKEWYEKFRWFYTSNNRLVLAGRDSKNNEQLVKKHLENTDLYYHADIHGAPHTVLKDGANSEDIEQLESAIFAGAYSSAWKNKVYSVDVYSVNSDQVSKTAASGESLGTGSFVIRGKREYFRKCELKLGIGYNLNIKNVMCGPLTAITKSCKTYFVITPGDDKKSTVCNKLKEKFNKINVSVSVDYLLSLLPPGNSTIL